MKLFINVCSRLLGEGRLSCRAGRATVHVDAAMTLHKPVIYGPAIEAAQASAVPSRAMTPPLPALSRFGSIEPVTYYQGAYL